MRLRFPNWKRFSLRSLFVLMTLCCFAFGVWGAYVSPYRLQMQSLVALNRLEGSSKPVADEGPGWQRWLVTKLLGDEAFVRIEAVDLSNRKVTAKDLRSLSGLCFLKTLFLDYTKVTDDSLGTLRSMPGLRNLSLRYTNISDPGVKHISALSNLRNVTLTGSKISDGAIDDLARLKQLNTLFIRWTRITSAGAERLQKELPNCEIYHHSLFDNVATAESK